MDRLSVRSRLVTSVIDFAGGLGGEVAIYVGGASWSDPWIQRLWRMLLRGRNLRPVLLEVVFSARIVHKDVHQDGKLVP